MIEVVSKINVFEINDKETDWQSNPIEIVNHWNSNMLVVLIVGGVKYTVAVKDIKAAIANAINTAK